MSGNYKKEDLRVIKTYKSLDLALLSLLGRINFRKITVNTVCEEALVSRSTFYTHFNDKYDLLTYSLTHLRRGFIQDIFQLEGEQVETFVNQIVHDHAKLITHIIEDADFETLQIIPNIISPIVAKTSSEGKNGSSNHMMLFHFCAGGIAHLLTTRVKNKQLFDDPFMNNYLFKMLQFIIEWDKTQQ